MISCKLLCLNSFFQGIQYFIFQIIDIVIIVVVYIFVARIYCQQCLNSVLHSKIAVIVQLKPRQGLLLGVIMMLEWQACFQHCETSKDLYLDWTAHPSFHWHKKPRPADWEFYIWTQHSTSLSLQESSPKSTIQCHFWIVLFWSNCCFEGNNLSTIPILRPSSLWLMVP